MAKNVKLSQKPESNYLNSIDDLGKHIKYQRTKLGLSREDAANMCSINHQTLYNIENGNEKCAVGNVFHVANMLGIKFITEIKE